MCARSPSDRPLSCCGRVRLTKALRKPHENVPAYSLRSPSQQAREKRATRCDKDHVLVESGRIISQGIQLLRRFSHDFPTLPHEPKRGASLPTDSCVMTAHNPEETSHVAQDNFRAFDRGRAERGDLGPDLRIRGRRRWRRLARWWLS